MGGTATLRSSVFSYVLAWMRTLLVLAEQRASMDAGSGSMAPGAAAKLEARCTEHQPFTPELLVRGPNHVEWL